MHGLAGAFQAKSDDESLLLQGFLDDARPPAPRRTHQLPPRRIVPQPLPSPSIVEIEKISNFEDTKVNSQNQSEIDTTRHSRVFVRDLSSEVDNQKLKEAFQPFGDVSDAKVIRDTITTKSKGYGFVSYPKREEAERAIEQMNGHWLGRSKIRTNWATRKPGDSDKQMYQNEKSYDEIYNQTSGDNTSVYVGNIGNLAKYHLHNGFSEFGRFSAINVFKKYAIVEFERKDDATRAIVKTNNSEIGGQMVRCCWKRSDEGPGHSLVIRFDGGNIHDFKLLLKNSSLTGENNVLKIEYWKEKRKTVMEKMAKSVAHGIQSIASGMRRIRMEEEDSKEKRPSCSVSTHIGKRRGETRKDVVPSPNGQILIFISVKNQEFHVSVNFGETIKVPFDQGPEYVDSMHVIGAAPSLSFVGLGGSDHDARQGPMSLDLPLHPVVLYGWIPRDAEELFFSVSSYVKNDDILLTFTLNEAGLWLESRIGSLQAKKKFANVHFTKGGCVEVFFDQTAEILKITFNGCQVWSHQTNGSPANKLSVYGHLQISGYVNLR